MHNTHGTICSRKRRGLTLIEILTALGIVGVLSGILMAVTSNVRQTAQITEETSLARNAVTAFLMTPMDHGGTFMPGYGYVENQEIIDDTGRTLYNAAEDAKRFPWRLAQYLDKNMASLYIGEHREYYETDPGTYQLSLHPSLGMNSIFVGGHYDGTRTSPAYEPSGRSRTEAYPNDMWIVRPSVAYNPTQMIVFISTHSVTDEFPNGVGYFRVDPPKSPSRPDWGSYNEEIPASMGNVHLRYDGKAVVAQLDGSVTMLNEEELHDMRRWSNQAAKYNEPNFSDWTRE